VHAFAEYRCEHAEKENKIDNNEHKRKEGDDAEEYFSLFCHAGAFGTRYEEKP